MEEEVLRELRLLRAEIYKLKTGQLATNEEAANYFQMSIKSWERLSHTPRVWVLSPALARRRLSAVRDGDES